MSVWEKVKGLEGIRVSMVEWRGEEKLETDQPVPLKDTNVSRS